MTKVHSEESEVNKAIEGSADEQRKAFKRIRNTGIYIENREQTMKKEPNFQSQKKCSGDIVFCSNCGAFCSKMFFYKHKAKCLQPQNEEIPNPLPIAFLSPKNDDPAFLTLIESMQDDEIGKICKGDEFILLIGSRLYQKDKSKPDKTMEVRKNVRSQLRVLGRLYAEFKDKEFNTAPENASAMFVRKNFPQLREAVQQLCEKDTDEDSRVSVKYGLKSSLYYLLINSANIIKGGYLEKDQEEEADEIDRFLAVLKLNQHIIFGDARYHINQSRQEKLRLPTRLPDEDGLIKLKQYTIEKIQELCDSFVLFTYHEFIEVRDATCARLTLFNARRGGEPSRLKVTQWLERKKWMPDNPPPLDDYEKKLIASMDIMYQPGKGNHLVPCLVPQDCVPGLQKLCDRDVRACAGVSSHNPFIFANTGGSMNHVVGWDSVHHVCKEAGIEGANLNATANRGRISTLFASLELPPEERPFFYAHMGHSAEVNLGTYQRPLPIQEILKVGKHLQQFDKGLFRFRVSWSCA